MTSLQPYLIFSVKRCARCVRITVLCHFTLYLLAAVCSNRKFWSRIPVTQRWMCELVVSLVVYMSSCDHVMQPTHILCVHMKFCCNVKLSYWIVTYYVQQTDTMDQILIYILYMSVIAIVSLHLLPVGMRELCRNKFETFDRRWYDILGNNLG